MPITEFSDGYVRRRIGYLGEAPPADWKASLQGIGYQIVELESNIDAPGYVDTLDSVVLSQRADRPSEIYHDLERVSAKLLNRDCRMYVRITSRADLQEKGRELVVNSLNSLKLPAGPLTAVERGMVAEGALERVGLPLQPFVYVCGAGGTWEEIARWIVANPAGRPPNPDLKIAGYDSSGNPMEFSAEQDGLIRRAFHDCANVRLERLADGLSGVLAYRAYAQLEKGLLGPQPVLQFVKLGNRRKVAEEYEKYNGHALMYVPFHLGPSLIGTRCALGATQGILVGDFVDGAEILRDCARRGEAVSALANLFKVTLRAWHEAQTTNAEISITELLKLRLPTEIPGHRKTEIEALGAKVSLQGAIDQLMRCGSAPVIVGTIHGDLQATNVFVRGDDAIIIDYERIAADMPLLVDPASLEAGLLVDAFGSDDRDINEIMSSIGPLYVHIDMLGELPPWDPKSESAWFYECVQQIRAGARSLQGSPGQYAVALAAALLGKAANPHVFDNRREKLRAAAFVLAEKIIDMIANKRA